MSEPGDKMPSEDKSERESVLRILDELVAHMHTSKNVSMVLIISAFILTPMSLVMAALLLSAPSFVPGHEVHFTGGNFANGPPNMSESNEIPPPGINPGHMPPPPGPPMFMIEGGPHGHHILDISTLIIIFIVVSIVLSSVFLFVGLKEFAFFSKWNKKFSKFMSLKDKIDKELGDE